MPRQPYYESDNADDLYGRRANAQPVGAQPYVPPQGPTPAQPYQRPPGPDVNAPTAPGFTIPDVQGIGAKPSGDTGYDWLGFAQGYTGGQNVSRGGSQGGFITGGQQYRGNLQPVVDAYNAKYGSKAKVAGVDKIDFGDGRGPQDVITSGGDFWYGGPSGSMQPGQGPGGGGGGGGQVGSYGANGMLTGSADAGGNDYLNTFRQAMLGQLKQYQQPTDLNSPTLAPQLTASRIANQRGVERARQALAEQAYAHDDLHGNGYGQQQQQLLEHAGAAQAQTEGGLVDTAEARRQAMLGQLLGLGSSQGLQERLAGNQLGFNYANLAQNKELAGDQLGFNYANLQSNQNRDAMLAALGYYDR